MLKSYLGLLRLIVKVGMSPKIKKNLVLTRADSFKTMVLLMYMYVY